MRGWDMEEEELSDPAYIKAFKALAKSRIDPAEADTVEREFYEESDRSCWILNAAWTELALERGIRAVLRPDLPTKFFDFEGPVGTFSAKIQMAYALGIFGSDTRHDLELIKLIRNTFAHSQKPLKFELPEVRAVCDHMKLPGSKWRILPPFMLRLPDTKSESWFNENHPKTRLAIGCYSIIYPVLNFAFSTQYKNTKHTSLP
jgi:hypothetical protein